VSRSRHGHAPTVEYPRLIPVQAELRIPLHAVLAFRPADNREAKCSLRAGRRSTSISKDSNFPRAYASAQRIMKAISEDSGIVVDSRMCPGSGLSDIPATSIASGAARIDRPCSTSQQHAHLACGQRAVGATSYLIRHTGVDTTRVAVAEPADKITTVSECHTLPCQSGGPHINPDTPITTLLTTPNSSGHAHRSDIVPMKLAKR